MKTSEKKQVRNKQRKKKTFSGSDTNIKYSKPLLSY